MNVCLPDIVLRKFHSSRGVAYSGLSRASEGRPQLAVLCRGKEQGWNHALYMCTSTWVASRCSSSALTNKSMQYSNNITPLWPRASSRLVWLLLIASYVCVCTAHRHKQMTRSPSSWRMTVKLCVVCLLGNVKRRLAASSKSYNLRVQSREGVRKEAGREEVGRYICTVGGEPAIREGGKRGR